MPSVSWFKYWDRIFWVFFTLTAITISAGGVAGLIAFEYAVLLGIFMFIIGAGKLASEIAQQRLLSYQDDMYNKMHQITQHLEKTFNLASMHKEKTEFRIHKLDEKRQDAEKRLDRNYRVMLRDSDRNYRDIVRKIIDLENRMNKVSRILKIDGKR